MVDEARIAAYGVSVERVEEGLKAIEYPGLASVQIIFNAFRQRPAGLFLGGAAARGGGGGGVLSTGARSARVCGRGATRATRRSRPTTIARSTATASSSTSARRSR